jgi:hypothetical protein
MLTPLKQTPKTVFDPLHTSGVMQRETRAAYTRYEIDYPAMVRSLAVAGCGSID